MPLHPISQTNHDSSIFHDMLTEISKLSIENSISKQYIEKFYNDKKLLNQQLLALEKIKYPIKSIKKLKYNLNQELDKNPYPNPYKIKQHTYNKPYWLILNISELWDSHKISITCDIIQNKKYNALIQKYDYVFPQPLLDISQLQTNLNSHKRYTFTDEFSIDFDDFKKLMNDPLVYNEFIKNPTSKITDHPLFVKNFSNPYDATTFLRFISTLNKYIRYSSVI